MTKKIILSTIFGLFSFFLIITQEQQNFPDFSKNICFKLCQAMSFQEQEIFANIVYLLYVNALLDATIDRYYAPLSHVTQQIRRNMTDFANPNDELAMAYCLLEDISAITKARLIYNTTLEECLNYYEQHKTETLDNALQALQINAQECLQKWAHEHSEHFTKSLKKSKTILSENAQNILVASNMLKGLSKGALPFNTTEENKRIAAINIVMKNNPIFMNHANNISNTLDETMDEAMNIIYIGVEIYRQYYEDIYAIITSSDQDSATILFDEYGLLPAEYRSSLPHVATVKEEIYKTTQQYSSSHV